jgi:hypothetical protein
MTLSFQDHPADPADYLPRPPAASYVLLRDAEPGGDPEVIESFPRVGLDGCLTAVGRAAWHSVGGAPVDVIIVGVTDEPRLLGRWVGGRQQLDPAPARSWRRLRYPIGE